MASTVLNAQTNRNGLSEPIQLTMEKLKILTHRLSDDYLDIDLLDEQVRSVLGYIRADEIVIR